MAYSIISCKQDPLWLQRSKFIKCATTAAAPTAAAAVFPAPLNLTRCAQGVKCNCIKTWTVYTFQLDQAGVAGRTTQLRLKCNIAV